MAAKFVVQEFVPPVIYHNFSNKSWWFISPKILDVAFELRHMVGQPLIINNWHTGGRMINRGYRPPHSNVGAPYSMHRLGLAIDVSSPGLTPVQLLKAIQDNRARFLELGLTTIEDPAHTPTWLHLDCRPAIEGVQPPNDFLFVKP